MTQYIQYDENGNITASVTSFGISPPGHPRQLVLEKSIEIIGKKIDLGKLEIVDDPLYIERIEAVIENDI